MTADSKFLVGFCYASLALGVVTGLNGIRILVELLFWSSAPTGAYAVALIANFGVAILALGVGLMVRHTLSNPYTYGGSAEVRGKWKWW